MSSEKVKINQGRVVPWQFRLAGTLTVFLAIIVAFAILPEYYAIAIAILVSFLLPLIWSTYYLLQIDLKEKTVFDGYWIVGLQKGETEKFGSVEKIFINKVQVGQNISSYSGHVHHFTNAEYKAFVKFDTGKKLELTSAKSPEKLFSKINPISKKLNCPVEKNYKL